MTRKNADQLFTKLLQNDQPGKPSQSVEERLMYAYNLKNCNSKLRQNSLAGFGHWLFSFQGIGLKTGLAAAILFFAMINKQLISESGPYSLADSLFSQRVLVADSTAFIQSSADSIQKDSLQ